MNTRWASPPPAIGIFQVAILVLSLAILGALAADTVFNLPAEVRALIQGVDTVVCVILLMDFGVRFYRADSKVGFLKWGWIDLLASIPNIDLLRWGRLIRVLRVIRLLRGIRSLHRVLTMLFQNKLQGGAVSLALLAFLLVSFSSVSILVCDREEGANIRTAEDAIWWSMTTVTTVGYGDKYPVTTEGRIVGIVLMFCGAGLFAGLSGLVVSLILGGKEREAVELNEILSRLKHIESSMPTARDDGGAAAEHHKGN